MELELENFNAQDSSVRSIWTYLTASPCYTTNTNKRERERERERESVCMCVWFLFVCLFGRERERGRERESGNDNKIIKNKINKKKRKTN